MAYDENTLDKLLGNIRGALRRLTERISALEQRGTDQEELLADLRSCRQMDQTAEEIRSQVGDLSGNLSTISQQVSSITFTVQSGGVTRLTIGGDYIDLDAAYVKLFGDMAVYDSASDTAASCSRVRGDFHILLPWVSP